MRSDTQSHRPGVVFAAGLVLALLVSGSASAARKGTAVTAGPQKVIIDAEDTAAARDIAQAGASKLVDYGSFSLWRFPGPSDSSVLARTGITLRNDFDTIALRGSGVDTRFGAPSVPADLRQTRGVDDQLWLVQFVGPVKPAWLSQLRDSGIEIVFYMPQNAYVVWAAGEALAALDEKIAAATSPVQWAGPYHPAYRLEPSLENAARTRPADEMVDVTVEVFETKQTDATIATLLSIGGAVRRAPSRVLDLRNISLQLPVKQLLAVASWADVYNVEPWLAPHKMDEAQGQIMAGNIQTVAGKVVPLTGAGAYLAWLSAKGFPATPTSYPVVGVVDDGVDNGSTNPLHPDLHQGGLFANPSRLIYNGNCTTDPTANGRAGHGNLNTGIVGSYNNLSGSPHQDANAFRVGLGISPYGRMGGTKIFTNAGGYSISACGGTDAGVVLSAYTAGANLTSNSWGANTAGAYDTSARNYDLLTRDAASATAGNQQMLHVFSAGNAGSGASTIGSPGTAKNVLTVGATENVREQGFVDGCAEANADDADDAAIFSSRGPCADGRVKPDIIAPGTHIQGPASQDPGYTGTGVCDKYHPLAQTLYAMSSGTSHSCPAVSGAASLLWNYYGRVLTAGLTPSPAMQKALLVNSARYLNAATTGGNLPSNVQGWGDVNLGTLFDGVARQLVDQTTVFSATGDQYQYLGTVADNTKPVRVTLVWTDPAGPTTGNAYVNDLNLTVTIGGNTYKGNVFSGASSVIGGAYDAKNNIEGVFLPAGVSGNALVRVTAANLAADGVPGSGGATDQDFALVIYNMVAAPPAPLVNVGTASLTAESCAPGNSTVDPGETVTLSFPLQNVGTANTTNLVATLQATGGVTSPSPAQNYGVLVAGGPTVTHPFTFVANASCGQPVTATLQLQDGATDLGLVTFPIPTGVLGAPTAFSYTGPAVPIPDNTAAGVNVNLPVAGFVGPVAKVTFSFDKNPAGACSAAAADANVGLDHTWVGDLIVTLKSPLGTTITLMSRPGGTGNSGNNFCNTVLDDAGATSIQSIAIAGNPYTGTFSPNAPLSAFAGENPNGTWVLNVADRVGTDTGSVRRFTINLAGYTCCVTTPVELVTFGVE